MSEPVSKQADERRWRWNRMWLQHKWMSRRILRGLQMVHPVRIPEIRLVTRAMLLAIHHSTNVIALPIGFDSCTCLFSFPAPAISEALRPYASASLLMDGKTDSNKAPSLLAVRCNGPCSAFSTLRLDSALRRPRYSTGASTLINEKSRLKLARPRLTSLVADTAEAAIFPMAAIE